MLLKYLENINKGKCPRKCPLYNKKMKPIVVPPPEIIKGIIISKEPTDWFNDWYTYVLGKENNLAYQRKMLFAAAIPFALVKQIIGFIKGDKDFDINAKILYEFIFKYFYWTHFCKCPKKSTAKTCANRWLMEEIENGIKVEAIIVISLAKNINNWILQSGLKDLHGNEGVKFVKLPHPMGNENQYWKNNEDNFDTKKAIVEIVKVCNEVYGL